MLLTIDASVFVSATIQSEVHFAESAAFLAQLILQPQTVYCPTLVITETVASVARRIGNALIGQEGIGQMIAFPGIAFIPLSEMRAQKAASIAAVYGLRGADSVYVAVAQELGTVLVTWDTEMLIRGGSAVVTITPNDWMTQQTTRI